MLIGEYKHTIDPKGRIIMPAKFREDLGEVFVVTKGLDGCLKAYPKKTWDIYEEKVSALPETIEAARKYKRLSLAFSAPCELDKQGRILISEGLRSYAGFKKDITIIGVSAYIELWDTEKWNEYSKEEVTDIEGLSAYGL